MRSAERRSGTGTPTAQLLLLIVVLGAMGALSCSTPPPRVRMIMPVARIDGGTPPAPAVASEASADPTEVAAATPVPDVTIAAVGDIMLARRLTTLMQQHGAAYPFERVRDLLEADIVVGNMEGAFTERGAPLLKQYTFRSPTEFAAALSGAGLDAVSLANNHATDFGVMGLEDTLAAIDRVGVRTFGAGLDVGSAAAPAVIHAGNGARVAFVGIDEIGEVLWAGVGRPGVARADLEGVRAAIEAARTEADYLVLFAHWGTEYSHTPTARQRQLATAAVEAGADLVIGAHPHVLQPVERVGGSLVLYSLGNFVFDLDSDDLRTLGEAPFQSVVAHVTLSRSAAPHLELRPVRTDPAEHRPRPATPEEAAPILQQLHELQAVPPVPSALR